LQGFVVADARSLDRGEKGRSGGGLAYGYQVSNDGEGGAGGRCINERQAIIIRRIFTAFARGETPSAIAAALTSSASPNCLWQKTTTTSTSPTRASMNPWCSAALSL